MSDNYFEIVINELNANCENRNLPLTRTGIKPKSKGKPETKRDAWTIYDIYTELGNGKLQWKKYCRIEWEDEQDEDGSYPFYELSLCKSCSCILDHYLSKLKDANIFNLKSEIEKIQNKI